MVVLTGLAAYVGVLLFSNLNAIVATESVKDWQSQAVLVDDKSWQRNLERIQTTLKLDPTNPEYLAIEAEIYRYRAYRFDPQSDEFSAANRQALDKYQHLLAQRPSWAPYWSNIIAIKYALWEYDQLMVDALRNAARLGPWFKRNQHVILLAGFHGWPFIDHKTREVVDETLERAMQLQPKETIKFAFEQGFANRLAPLLIDAELEEMYAKEIKKRGWQEDLNDESAF